MANKQDIGDDEIRIIGANKPNNHPHKPWWFWTILSLTIIAIVVLLVVLLSKHENNNSPNPADTSHTGNTTTDMENSVSDNIAWLDNTDDTQRPRLSITDTTIDSLNLQIITPLNTIPELYIGKPDSKDTSILLATLAADIRRDNGKIVGAFVYAGEPLSWGLSKRGYCAIIDECLTLGTAENSPLFEQATGQDGYFFRQYSAVDKGIAVTNNPENAAPRRALCVIGKKYCIVATANRVLMNDFSQALVKLGASDAIYLVGGRAHGWWRDGDGHVNNFPESNPSRGNKKYINYIIFRKN